MVDVVVVVVVVQLGRLVFACLSVCQSVRLSVCPSVSLSVSQSVCLSVCPSVCLSVCVSGPCCLVPGYLPAPGNLPSARESASFLPVLERGLERNKGSSPALV